MNNFIFYILYVYYPNIFLLKQCKFSELTSPPYEFLICLNGTIALLSSPKKTNLNLVLKEEVGQSLSIKVNVRLLSKSKTFYLN